MAVKASANITLTSVVDIKATYRYYLLQSSTLAKPSKPTTNPPSSSWGDSEPTYTSGSTNSLYYVDLTVFSDDTFAYSDVSLSTAYEAAKEAYNKAVAAQGTADSAQNTANNAQSDIDNLEIGGKNLLLNSSFTENFDNWTFNWPSSECDIEIVENPERGACAHITGAIGVTQMLYQDVLDKIDLQNLDQTYTYSADIKLDNYVAGTTNPYVQLYFNGRCDEGTPVWMGATTVSGDRYISSHSDEGWIRMSWVVRFDKVPSQMECHLYARDFTGDLYFKNLKLEKGNRATDWTPAPEDVNEEIADVQNSANTNAEQIRNALLMIDNINAMIQTLVTGENGESLMTQTDTGWTFSMADIQNTLGMLGKNVGTLTEDSAETKSLIDGLNQSIADLGEYTDYIKFGVDGGKPCIYLGETDSVFKVLITNTDIRFVEGSVVPASISNQALNIETAIVNKEIRQGGFSWNIRANGNYSLSWKG